MPATHFLATLDPDLLRDWWVAVAQGRPVMTLAEEALPDVLPIGVPVLVIQDAAVAERLPLALADCPMILVGEPGTSAFDAAKRDRKAKICLTYDESRSRLATILPLIEEIAERAAAQALLAEKSRRADHAPRAGTRAPGWADATETWDFLENAAEAIGSQERLLTEFRRAVRSLLRSSATLFFLRDDNGFRSDVGGFFCPADDPIIRYLSSHPAVLDGAEWPGDPDLVTEMSARHRLAQWSSRLLAPLHENGRLQGFIVCGVRDDGRAYEPADKARAIFLARLLRQFLAQSTRVSAAQRLAEQWRIGESYLPHVAVFGPREEPDKHLPPAVRALIEQARKAGATRRLAPSPGQPLRARAGVVAETQGVWAWWEHAGDEVRDELQARRAERVALLRDLALTLNHEIGNALVSLSALRHNPGAETNSPVLLAAIKRDIASLEEINQNLASIPTFSEVNPETVDLRTLLFAVHRRSGVAVQVGSVPVMFSVVPRLVEFALEAIVNSIAENRPGLGVRELNVHLRTSAEGENVMAIVAVQGAGLELEGILPAPESGSAPAHGRIGVFIAKEIIRLHGGELHAVSAEEIAISLRRW